jgi:hypothetical protein
MHKDRYIQHIDIHDITQHITDIYMARVVNRASSYIIDHPMSGSVSGTNRRTRPCGCR